MMIQSNIAVHQVQSNKERIKVNNEYKIDYLLDLTLFSLLYRFLELEKIELTLDEFLVNMDNVIDHLNLEQSERAEFRLYQYEDRGFIAIDRYNRIALTEAGIEVSKVYFPKFLYIFSVYTIIPLNVPYMNG